MNITETVRDFTRACHEDLPDKPVLMSQKSTQFLTNMVSDELAELDSAMTLHDQADALVDTIYYIVDTAVRHGMNLDKIFALVHNANMKKVVRGKVIRREDGKIMKPSGWRDPGSAIALAMEQQERFGSFRTAQGTPIVGQVQSALNSRRSSIHQVQHLNRLLGDTFSFDEVKAAVEVFHFLEQEVAEKAGVDLEPADLVYYSYWMESYQIVDVIGAWESCLVEVLYIDDENHEHRWCVTMPLPFNVENLKPILNKERSRLENRITAIAARRI